MPTLTASSTAWSALSAPEPGHPPPGRLRSVPIGPRLKRYRQRAGLTQAEIARRLQVCPGMTSRWECETSTRYQPVPGERLPALADLLCVPLAELAPELEVPGQGPVRALLAALGSATDVRVAGPPLEV
jgi:transcriptional regulator with XRE-family HTH domain